jgi:hypothetical protein
MELGAALRELSEQGVWRVHLVLSADRKSVSYPQWRLVRAQAVSGPRDARDETKNSMAAAGTRPSGV